VLRKNQQFNFKMTVFAMGFTVHPPDQVIALKQLGGKNSYTDGWQPEDNMLTESGTRTVF